MFFFFEILFYYVRILTFEWIMCVCVSLIFSREIPQQGFVNFISLNVKVTYEHFNLFFDHLWIRLEHLDVSNDVSNEGLIWVLLVSLHDLHDFRLNDVFSFSSNLYGMVYLFSRRLCTLLFNNFKRHVANLYRC